MTGPINMALYRWMVQHGADEATAEQAARIDASELATKADLHIAIAELKAELFKHTTQTLVWLTGINAAILTAILALFRWAGER